MILRIGFLTRFRVVACLIATIAILSCFAVPPAQAASGLFSNMTPLTEPTPASNNNLGLDGVALSADGLTALVSAPYATVGSNVVAGKAYIYHYANGQWTLAQEIDNPDAGAQYGAEFGSILVLNGNGTAALIGSRNRRIPGFPEPGPLYLYTLSGGSWSQTHAFTAATSAGLSSDGMEVVFGEFDPGINAPGQVYIYADTNGTWVQTADITDPDGLAQDQFGSSVALSGNGGTLLVGSDADVNGQNQAGKAYLYTLANGVWNQAQEFDDPASTAGDFFGDPVALSADGTAAAISVTGAAVNGQAGAGIAYIYTESNGSWSHVAISDPDAKSNDGFGSSVAISSDGKNALFGSDAAVNGQAGAGKAYFYTLAGNTWKSAMEIDDPAATQNDCYGACGVALSGTAQTAFISAPSTTVNGQAAAGKAYLYQTPSSSNGSSGSSGGGGLGILSLLLLLGLSLLGRHK